MYKLLNKFFSWFTELAYSLTKWSYKQEIKFAKKYIKNLDTITDKLRDKVDGCISEKNDYKAKYSGEIL